MEKKRRHDLSISQKCRFSYHEYNKEKKTEMTKIIPTHLKRLCKMPPLSMPLNAKHALHPLVNVEAHR